MATLSSSQRCHVVPTCRAGDELRVYDGRPNGEMVLATGSIERDNPADHLIMQARTCWPASSAPSDAILLMMPAHATCEQYGYR